MFTLDSIQEHVVSAGQAGRSWAFEKPRERLRARAGYFEKIVFVFVEGAPISHAEDLT